jgi:hypothetical protein
MSSPKHRKRRLVEMSADEHKAVLAGLSEAEIEKKLIDEIGAFSDLEWHRAYKRYNAHRPTEPLSMTTIPHDKIEDAVKKYNDMYERQIQQKKDYTKRKKGHTEQKKIENTNASVPIELDSIEFDEDFFSQDVDQHDGGYGNKSKHKQSGTKGTKRRGTKKQKSQQKSRRRQQKSRRRRHN